MSSTSCSRCAGRGRITHPDPTTLGRCSNVAKVFSAHPVPINRFCRACDGTDVATPPLTALPTVAPDPESAFISIGGYAVDAPGFTPAQLERAIVRAVIDQLEIHATAGDYLVCHRGVNGGYRLTRISCDCPAGHIGIPCKHLSDHNVILSTLTRTVNPNGDIILRYSVGQD